MAGFDPSPDVYYRCGNRGCHQVIPPERSGWCWTCMEMGVRLTRRTQTECSCGCQEADERAPLGSAREVARGRVSHHRYAEGGEEVGEFQVHLLRGVALLCGLEVYPRYRGRGVGRRVLDAQVTEALRLATRLRMVVKRGNGPMMRIAFGAGFRSVWADDHREETTLELEVRGDY